MLADWIERHCWRLVIGVAVVIPIAVGVLVTRGLRRDYTLEAFVASDSDAYREFRGLMEEFSSNEFAVYAMETPDATSDETLAMVEWIVGRARALPAVGRTASIADVPERLRFVLGDWIWKHPLFVDTLVGRDGKTVAVLLQMTGEGATGAVRKETVGALKSILVGARERFPGTTIYLAGPYVTLIDMYDYVDQDLICFSGAAFALILLTLGIVFRRVGPVVYCVGVSMAATACALGVASALDWPTTLVTQMVLILVVVLSVANCVHVGVADDEVFARTPFLDWRERVRRVLREMVAPCSAVMVTTMVGFGSVSISGITPVRMFGWIMVIGLGFALVFSLICAPLLAWSRAPSATARVGTFLPGRLQQLGVLVARNRWRAILGFAVGTGVFVMGLPWLGFESDFVKNFRPESEVRRSYEFISSHLSPTGSMEVVVRRRDGGVIVTADAVGRLRTAGLKVTESFEQVRKVLGLADVLTVGEGDRPTTDFGVRARLAGARSMFGDGAIRNFLNDDQTGLRLNFRVAEGVSVGEKQQLGIDVEAMVADVMGEAYSATVTGLYVFYSTLVCELWRDQIRSLGVTVPAVLLVLVMMLRSVRVGLTAIVPTVLPIVFCLGAMAWVGIAVNMTTAMMLSVTTGIAVDDAIHYLWRFRRRLRETGDYDAALRDAHASVGRACVFTTVVIAGGFWILTLSRFLPTAYFGGLLAFTMCCALAGNLILLPALVMTFKPFGLPVTHKA